MPLNRRHFLFGALAAPVLAATKKHAVAERPNIVLIVAEDLGAYMLGCYANSEVHTPNIDRLAQTGGRFHNSFSCSPLGPGPSAFAAAGYNCNRGSSATQGGGVSGRAGSREAVFPGDRLAQSERRGGAAEESGPVRQDRIRNHRLGRRGGQCHA